MKRNYLGALVILTFVMLFSIFDTSVKTIWDWLCIVLIIGLPTSLFLLISK